MEKFVGFSESKSFREAVNLYSDGINVSIYTIFTGLTDYIIEELIKRNKEITNAELTIYNFIEEMREKLSGFSEGTEEYDFDNAICTCFLENLLNSASSNNINYDRFISFLGEKSKEYCKAWDKYTGVRSPGLWTDAEWFKD